MSCQITRTKPFSSAGSCSSADIIGGNDDLLTEILMLLPAKTLVKFKSVSKQWQSLISSEYFTRRHVQIHDCHRRAAETQHSFRQPFMICRPTIKASFPINLPNHAEGVTILQSMNGLILLSLKLGEIHCAVFNPTTQAYRIINLDGYASGLVKIWLFYDPSKSEHYKVVMKTSALIRPFSVYDSATHQWSHGWNCRAVINSVFGCNFGSSRVETIANSKFLFHVCGLLLIYRSCHDDEEKEDLEVMVDYRNDDGFYVQDELPFEYVHTFIHTFASV